jgi:phenylacetate-CoA ligase
MVSALDVYHRLPAPARNLVASGRGYYLRRWRYGADTDAMADEALARESWPPERWAELRRERLDAILARAGARVPHYRELWARRGRRPSRELSDWPILAKDALRAELKVDPVRFLADDRDRRRMFHEHTSGTTGTPLELWWSRETVRAWYALFEARVRRWNGVTRHDRWAILGGQLVTPYRQTRPPYWVWNRGLHQLYLSNHHLSPQTVESYLGALERYRVKYLFGYASSLYALALLAEEQLVPAPHFPVAISNAEPLFAHQREMIARKFGCAVRDTYGMAEIVCAGSECAAGVLHEWPEVGILEILADDADVAVPPGTVGRIVATGLLNPDMPLVRYDTGDRGSWEQPDEPCACGRRLPVLRSVEGRADDVILTPDGRRVGRLDPVFKAGFAIREAQIVQERLDLIRVRYVPATGFGQFDLAGIERALRQRIGDSVEIVLEQVESIPRTRAGKFRAVVSEIGDRAGSGEPVPR